ncbi:hypothetical protein BGZ79_007762 [Entomortierella chlamydospora]|nr:hypothetical protein BGZ79_007762 [Entomortierella chlamydospora]
MNTTTMCEQPDTDTPWHQTNQDNTNEYHPCELDLGDGSDPIREGHFDDTNHYYHNVTSLHENGVESDANHSPAQLAQVSSTVSPRNTATTADTSFRPATENRDACGSSDLPPLLGQGLATVYTMHGNADCQQPTQAEIGHEWGSTAPSNWRPQFSHYPPPNIPSIPPSVNLQPLGQWTTQHQFYDQEPRIAQSSPYSSFPHPIHSGYQASLGYQPSFILSPPPERFSETSLPSELAGNTRQHSKASSKARPFGASTAPVLFHRSLPYSNLSGYSSYPTFPTYRNSRPNDLVLWDTKDVSRSDGLPTSAVGSTSNSRYAPTTPLSSRREGRRDSPTVMGLATSGLGNAEAQIQDQQGQHQQNLHQNAQENQNSRPLTKHELLAMDPDPKFCNNCGATTTPSWRRCPQGRILLCNACGLYQKLHGRSRPFFKARDGTIKIHRTLPEHPPCTVCGTTRTPIWSKGSKNEAVCFGCNLNSKNGQTKSGTKTGAKGHAFGDSKNASKSRGISKKKSTTQKGLFSSVTGAASNYSDHAAHSVVACEPRFEGLDNEGVYSTVGWNRQCQLQQPQRQSHQYIPPYNSQSSFVSNQLGSSSDDSSAFGGYYWNHQQQEYYPQESYEQQCQQLQYRHQTSQQSYQYQEPESGAYSNSYNFSATQEVYAPPSMLSAIPLDTPSYVPDSPQAPVKDDPTSSDSQATGQSQQALPIGPSEATNTALPPSLPRGNFVEDVKKEDDERHSIKAPSTAGSELTPVRDSDSD